MTETYFILPLHVAQFNVWKKDEKYPTISTGKLKILDTCPNVLVYCVRDQEEKYLSSEQSIDMKMDALEYLTKAKQDVSKTG